MTDPNDIRTPKELVNKDDLLQNPHHVYSGTLGRAEYEIIAQILVEDAQRKGFWNSMDRRELEKNYLGRIHDRESINEAERGAARNEIDDMIKNGILDRSGRSVYLAPKARDAIAEKYLAYFP